VLYRLLDLLDDVVVAFEEPEGPVALGEILDVAGNSIDELTDLIDEDRHEDRRNAHRGDEHRAKRERHGKTSPTHASTL